MSSPDLNSDPQEPRGPWVRRRWLLAVGLAALLYMCSRAAAPSSVTPSPVAMPPQKAETPGEFKLRAQAVAFDDLARDTSRFVGRAVVYTGKVVQVAGSRSSPVYRINVTEMKFTWDDTVWVNGTVDPPVLEDDIIRVWGIVKGEHTYEAVLGNMIRLPEIDARVIEVVRKRGVSK